MLAWPLAYSLAAALETLQAGGGWPQSRVHAAYPDVLPQCTLCGCAYADSLHTYWTCPALLRLEDVDVSQTNHLIDEAIDGYFLHPCLWLRGIVPSSFTSLVQGSSNLIQEFLFTYHLNHPPCGEWPSGDYFLDGSGGRDAAFPSIRRCGIWVARLRDSEFEFGVESPLPGDVQTVPRAEISASIIVCMHVM